MSRFHESSIWLAGIRGFSALHLRNFPDDEDDDDDDYDDDNDDNDDDDDDGYGDDDGDDCHNQDDMNWPASSCLGTKLSTDVVLFSVTDS